MDHATNSLWKALKQDMVSKERKVDSTALRKAGCSERLIARLEN